MCCTTALLLTTDHETNKNPFPRISSYKEFPQHCLCRFMNIFGVTLPPKMSNPWKQYKVHIKIFKLLKLWNLNSWWNIKTSMNIRSKIWLNITEWFCIRETWKCLLNKLWAWLPSPWATQMPRTESAIPCSMMEGLSWIFTVTNRDS